MNTTESLKNRADFWLKSGVVVATLFALAGCSNTPPASSPAPPAEAAKQLETAGANTIKMVDYLVGDWVCTSTKGSEDDALMFGADTNHSWSVQSNMNFKRNGVVETRGRLTDDPYEDFWDFQSGVLTIGSGFRTSKITLPEEISLPGTALAKLDPAQGDPEYTSSNKIHFEENRMTTTSTTYDDPTKKPYYEDTTVTCKK